MLGLGLSIPELSGRGSGGGGAPSAGTAKVESIDLSTVGTYATVTSIDGTDLSEFAYVFGTFRNAQSTISLSSVRGELSVDGSTWRNSAGDYRIGSYDNINTNAADSGFFEVHNDGGAVYTNFVLSNIKGAAPTCLRGYETATGSSVTEHVAYSSASVEDAAVRFFDSGGEDWASGTLELFGIIGGTPTIQTHDFGVTSGNQTFTIPAGHVVGTLIADDLTCSSSSNLALRLSTGGTPLSGATDYRVGFMNAASSGSQDGAQVNFSDTGTTGLAGLIHFWGLNTAVPTIIDAAAMNTATANPTLVMGAPSATTPVAYDEVQIFTPAGTLNAGVVTLITWPGTVDIETVDFGAAAAATHDFTGLGSYPIVAMMAPTLTVASAGAAYVRTSTNGSTFDSGASDYRYGHMHDGWTGDGVANRMDVAGSTGSTAKGFLSTMGGMGSAAYLTQSYQELGPAANALRGHGSREAAQTNVALRLGNVAAANFNVGKVYRAGIALT